MNTFPTDAKKVFTGVIFDVYQWEQEMFDGSTATFERLKRPNSVQIIAITKDKKIILLDQEQPNEPPFVTVPSGRVEEGEAAETAAHREMLEETGYTTEELIPFSEKRPYSKIDWTIYTYIAHNCRKVQEQNLDAGEKISLRLISFEEFLASALNGELESMDLTLELLRAQADPAKMDILKTKLGL